MRPRFDTTDWFLILIALVILFALVPINPVLGLWAILPLALGALR